MCWAPRRSGSVKVFLMMSGVHRYLPAAEPTPNTRMPPPTLALRLHVKGKHVKDAQDVVEDVTQDVVEGMLGAAEDGGLKVLILSILIFQRRNPRIYIAASSAL